MSNFDYQWAIYDSLIAYYPQLSHRDKQKIVITCTNINLTEDSYEVRKLINKLNAHKIDLFEFCKHVNSEFSNRVIYLINANPQMFSSEIANIAKLMG